jgi:uncharacterized protein with HEPN domain
LLPSEHPERRFENIIDNIDRIERFTAGMDLAAFVVNEPMVYGVQYAPVIISEAARKPGAHAERLAPNQPWGDIRSIGNVLQHQYDDVSPKVVGWIVQRDLAKLKAAARQPLLDLSAGQAEGKTSDP